MRSPKSAIGFVALLSSLSPSAFGQRSLRGDALRDAAFLSGLGVVGREIAGETDCAPNASGNRQLPLLESIHGPAAARLEWRRGLDGGCEAFLVGNDKSERLYRGWDFPEISYESAAVVYYEQRDGFARVFARRMPPGLWVRIADMPGGRLRPWSELLVASPQTYRGYEGHALHEQPSEDSRLLVTLRERKVHDTRVHQLTPTGELSGSWGRFDVVEFNADFYLLARVPGTAPTGNRWQGWLRLVNSVGAPEFWFFTRD